MSKKLDTANKIYAYLKLSVLRQKIVEIFVEGRKG